MINNHLSHLLAKWYPQRDKCDWVLATIYKTEGPCYRKAGSMMLFSSLGEQLGMLSGGCLESDIGINARKVMQTGQAKYVCYDGSDEEDLSFHLGIGCGGTVYITLQPVNAENNYLALIDVYEALQQRVDGYYYLPLVLDDYSPSSLQQAPKAHFSRGVVAQIDEFATVDNEKQTLRSPIVPLPHILLVGGGIDAVPLANMAKQLGWQVSLWDPRPANGRKEYFGHLNHIVKGDEQVLPRFVESKQVNAAILMSHNVELDAKALQVLANSNASLQYVALLGPLNRRQQVISQAQVNVDELAFVFSGPAGLELGGTLPESIALSILSECHASLYNKGACSISQVLQ
ncbi:MAG: XdhC family protein [Colwellia sp.]